MKSALSEQYLIHKNNFNKLEKGICRYRVTAFIEKIFAGFRGTIMQD